MIKAALLASASVTFAVLAVPQAAAKGDDLPTAAGKTVTRTFAHAETAKGAGLQTLDVYRVTFRNGRPVSGFAGFILRTTYAGMPLKFTSTVRVGPGSWSAHVQTFCGDRTCPGWLYIDLRDGLATVGTGGPEYQLIP